MEFDENITTRTRLAAIQKQMEEQEQQRKIEHSEMVERVKEIAAAIDSRNATGLTRVWIWVKKVLSFAHSEAEKIRLED